LAGRPRDAGAFPGGGRRVPLGSDVIDGRYLPIYLNDHRAGALAGLELAKRAAGSNEDSDYGEPLRRIAQEIDEDVDALDEIMEALGVGHDRIKMIAAFVGEKLGRLKLNGQITGYSPLSRLVELEGLTLGVEGKLRLWRSLLELAPLDSRLDEARLDELARRADRQRRTLERLRRRAAGEALA
jgi:hypothetical protein